MAIFYTNEKGFTVAAGLALLLGLVPTQVSPAAETPAVRGECVVLLHGLARTARSMRPMEKALKKTGYLTVNRGYPSTKYPIEQLAAEHVPPALAACSKQGGRTTHFVTHSMGGIVLRQYLNGHAIPELGRVVMLSPPSQGSETVDKLGGLAPFQWLNGPAGGQLGTGEDGVPRSLGPATFEVGIITGTRSINPILSQLIPGPDDGKVGVDRARLDGMADFLTVPYSHTVIMSRRDVIRATLHFLQHGRFPPDLKQAAGPAADPPPAP